MPLRGCSEEAREEPGHLGVFYSKDQVVRTAEGHCLIKESRHLECGRSVRVCVCVWSDVRLSARKPCLWRAPQLWARVLGLLVSSGCAARGGCSVWRLDEEHQGPNLTSSGAHGLGWLQWLNGCSILLLLTHDGQHFFYRHPPSVKIRAWECLQFSRKHSMISCGTDKKLKSLI